MHGVPGRSILKVADPSGFANGQNDGEFFEITTNSANSVAVESVDLFGLQFECALLPNTDPAGTGTAWPNDSDARVQWEQANNKENGTRSASALRIADAWINNVSVHDCNFFMDDETHANHHWAGSGGDSALSIDSEEVRFVDVGSSRFYGSSDSSVYVSQVGTRSDTMRYPAKVNIHDNYFEGCGNGVHVKGAVVGGQVHDNVFVNCANPMGATSGNADVSELVRFHHNTIDGYWQAVRLQGYGALVDNNTIINGGHFAEDGSSMSDSGATLDNFFDRPVVFYINTGGGSATADGNVISDNDVWPEAAAGAFGRTVDWGGDKCDVFRFSDTDGNRCHNNRIHGTGWGFLAQSTGTSADNLVSWSDSSMIDAHDEMEWKNPASSEAARGPIQDTYLSEDEDPVNNSTSVITIDDFKAPGAKNAVYKGHYNIVYTAAAGADLRVKVATPGSSTAAGWMRVEGPSNSFSGTTSQTYFDIVALDSGVRAVGSLGTTTPAYCRLEFTAELATDGDIEFRWAQNTANASDAIVLKHSNGYVERIK